MVSNHVYLEGRKGRGWGRALQCQSWWDTGQPTHQSIYTIWVPRPTCITAQGYQASRPMYCWHSLYSPMTPLAVLLLQEALCMFVV